ncbi:hypothetical protein DENSPDRAFT_83091 [Dentipellis sp. KUC8613]|nr:hypothetical protein DENSPDRAFT_83091 [Dentipellis sp. KUC8613]
MSRMSICIVIYICIASSAKINLYVGAGTPLAGFVPPDQGRLVQCCACQAPSFQIFRFLSVDRVFDEERSNGRRSLCLVPAEV